MHPVSPSTSCWMEFVEIPLLGFAGSMGLICIDVGNVNKTISSVTMGFALLILPSASKWWMGDASSA